MDTGFHPGSTPVWCWPIAPMRQLGGVISRSRATGALALLLAMVMGCGPAEPSASTPALVWGPCPAATPDASGRTAARDPRQQCTSVTVPADYAHPDDATLVLTVSRLATATAGHRKGYLLVHPGGPGAPGLDFPSVESHILPQAILDEYDLIGVDDRGVGNSSPVTCHLDMDQRQAARADPWPTSGGDFTPSRDFALSVVSACTKATGPALPLITTRNVARDLDRIRGALGVDTWSYWGISYGTYLGLVYASMFGDHTSHVVLDSTDPPSGVEGAVRMWGKAFTDSFPALARWIAGQVSLVHRGVTAQEVTDNWMKTVARLDENPVHLAGHRVLDGNALRAVTKASLENPAYYPMVAKAWAVADGDMSAQSPVAPSVQLPTVIPDNFLSDQFAVMCQDTNWPRDLGQFPQTIAAEQQRYPLANGMGANAWPCNYWPSAPAAPVVTYREDWPQDILLLQNQFDPAAPSDGATQTLRLLGDHASMITVEVTGHGVDMANPCVVRFVRDFFESDRLPPSATCQP